MQSPAETVPSKSLDIIEYFGNGIFIIWKI